jgi:hypothetical protein
MKSFLAGVLVLLFYPVRLLAQDQEAERRRRAATVVEEVVGTPPGIWKDLLNKAVCGGLLPSFEKVALANSGGWGVPAAQPLIAMLNRFSPRGGQPFK